MRGTHLIEVAYKKGVVDPVARGLASDIQHWGGAKVQKVATAQLYRVAGDLKDGERETIASQLLSDPIVQEYRDGTWSTAGTSGKGKTADPLVIDVWFKSGVTDVVGESVLKGIKDLDVKGVTDVRTGMRYRLWGLPNKADADKVALALLINPLIHERVIHADAK